MEEEAKLGLVPGKGLTVALFAFMAPCCGSALTGPPIKLLPKPPPTLGTKSSITCPGSILGIPRARLCPGETRHDVSLPIHTFPGFLLPPFGGLPPPCQAPRCGFSHARALTSPRGCSIPPHKQDGSTHQLP